MATTTLNTRIALKADTAERWGASTLVLLKGEPALEIDTGRWKFGDGVQSYPQLEYANISVAEIQALIQQYAVNNVALVTGDTNGRVGITIDGTTSYVDVKGLQSAAYKTEGSFATAAQGTKADAAMPKSGGTFTGAVTLKANPTAALGAATKQYVDAKISEGIGASNKMSIQGTIGSTGADITALPTTYEKGWMYRVITDGTYAGQVCEPGDFIIALIDRSGTGNVNADWTVIQTNIDGAITNAGSGLTKTGTTVKHSNSITAGTAQGGSGAVAFGGTITIPKITYDSTGHVTSVGTTSVTLPANPNSDTKVTNTLETTTKAYVTGTTSATTGTGTQVFDTGVYLDTVAGQLVADTFKGKLTGNVTGNVSGSSGSCTGNSASSNKLTTLRNFSITGGATAAAVGFNGTANATFNVTKLDTDFLQNGSNTLILSCGDSTTA